MSVGSGRFAPGPGVSALSSRTPARRRTAAGNRRESSGPAKGTAGGDEAIGAAGAFRCRRSGAQHPCAGTRAPIRDCFH